MIIATKIKKVMIKRFFSFLAATFWGTSLNAGVEPMRVLFIGNSYTHMNSMPALFEKMAISKGIKIEVGMSAKSSHTFKMHCNRPEMFEAIRSKKWDYVVLQGFSRELTYEPSYLDTASVPYFNQIVDSIKSNNACTNVLLYMTWGYKDGFADREEVDSYEKMSDAVRNGYKYLSEIYNFPIVPVGDVYREIRKKTDINLYEADNQHPTPFGSYAVASTFYSSIFKTSAKNAFPGKLTPEDAATIQDIAFNVVSKNLSKYKLLNNTMKVSNERTKMGQYFVECESNYPNSTSVHWNFGDGTSSNKTKVKHEYKNPGEYWVILTVDDECGQRIIKRKVKFVAPPPPTPNVQSKPKVTTYPTKKI